MPSARPIPHPEFGAFLVQLREAKGWSQKSASDIARRRKIPLTYQALRGVESGATKDVEPATLLALAKLYETPYGLIAAEFFRVKFGVVVDPDLIRHVSDQLSGAPQGDTRDGATTTRLLELERQVSQLALALGKVENVAGELIEIAKSRLETPATAGTRPGRRRRV